LRAQKSDHFSVWSLRYEDCLNDCCPCLYRACHGLFNHDFIQWYIRHRPGLIRVL